MKQAADTTTENNYRKGMHKQTLKNRWMKNAVNHFVDFHKGAVNIILHLIGFAGLFYSIYRLNWILFTASFIVVEAGHVYNHITGLKKYDFRLSVTFCGFCYS